MRTARVIGVRDAAGKVRLNPPRDTLIEHGRPA